MAWSIQGRYDGGTGWEDLTSEDAVGDAADRLAEYDENEPQYPHRMVWQPEHEAAGRASR